MDHLDSDQNDEIADFLKKSANAQIPVKRSKEAIWDNISDAIDDNDENSTKTIVLWRYVGVAAAVSVLITFWLLFFNKAPEQIMLATEVGESIDQELPDGSTVSLNASSSISYSEDWDRVISLEGEAFFEVMKGEKFEVITPLGTVEVLGTSFNVFARNNDFEVSCKTGEVWVTIQEKQVVEELTPGEMISLKADTIIRMDRLPDLMGKWQSGEFYFNNQPLDHVIEELKRQFNVEIEYEASELLFSGYFINENVETALDMVCLPLGLQYQKTGQNAFAISTNDQ